MTGEIQWISGLAVQPNQNILRTHHQYQLPQHVPTEMLDSRNRKHRRPDLGDDQPLLGRHVRLAGRFGFAGFARPIGAVDDEDDDQACDAADCLAEVGEAGGADAETIDRFETKV